jgi:hypothetical protein
VSLLYVGPHVEHLHTGRPLSHGDVVERVEPADQRLIDRGLLVPLAPTATLAPPPAIRAPRQGSRQGRGQSAAGTKSR